MGFPGRVALDSGSVRLPDETNRPDPSMLARLVNELDEVAVAAVGE